MQAVSLNDQHFPALNQLDQRRYPESLYSVSSHYYDRINSVNLYIQLFGYLPNITMIYNIQVDKAFNWFSERYRENITASHYDSRQSAKQKSVDCESHFVLFNDLLINFSDIQGHIKILSKSHQSDVIKELVVGLLKFKIRQSRGKPVINLLSRGSRGLELEEIEINRYKLDLDAHYNDDFSQVHQQILNRLREPKDKGLVLLHGKPGTGKTSYIRYLLPLMRKKVIFIPPNMVELLTDPSMIAFFAEHRESILVIEDAESVVMEREYGKNTTVSNLLNISDGILSDCLQLQIICTFNTNLNKVDKALLRKGRLIASYEFKELTIEKANALAQKLGKTKPIEKPITISEIFNQDEPDTDIQINKQKEIGFRLAVG